MDLLPAVPDGSVDMILCDLPYGTTQCKWDAVLLFEPLWEQYKRITKPNAAIVLFSAEPFTAQLISSNRKMFRYDLIWSKGQGTDFLNANRKPLRAHENICVFYRKQPKYNKQWVYGKKPYASRASDSSTTVYGKYTPRDCASDGRRNPTTVLSFHRETGLHPTQKPVALLEWLVRTYTDEGDTVLDNCMGSGSTGIACLKTLRGFIGMEKDEGYFDTAVRRMKGEN